MFEDEGVGRSRTALAALNGMMLCLRLRAAHPAPSQAIPRVVVASSRFPATVGRGTCGEPRPRSTANHDHILLVDSLLSLGLSLSLSLSPQATTHAPAASPIIDPPFSTQPSLSWRATPKPSSPLLGSGPPFSLPFFSPRLRRPRLRSLSLPLIHFSLAVPPLSSHVSRPCVTLSSRSCTPWAAREPHVPE